jgi:hypothetical protein
LSVSDPGPTSCAYDTTEALLPNAELSASMHAGAFSLLYFRTPDAVAAVASVSHVET